jgi:hypothetical protein
MSYDAWSTPFSSADYQPYAIKTEAHLAAANLAGVHAVQRRSAT